MRVLFLLWILPTAALAAPWAEVSGEPEAQTFAAQSRHDFALSVKLLQPLTVGSQLRVLTPREGGWSQPSVDPQQEEVPNQFGLVRWTLDDAPGATPKGEALQYSDRGPPYTKQDRVSQFQLTVAGATLPAGARLRIEFPNARVSRIALHPEPSRNRTGYRLQVKPSGGAEWQELAGPPVYGIHPGPPFRIALRGASQVTRGESREYAVVVLDRWGNPAVDFTGKITVSCSDAMAKIPSQLPLAAADHAVGVLGPVVFQTPGLQTLTVNAGTKLEGAEQSAVSVEVLAEAPPLNLYWGELHSHGMFSYDARNWGGCTMRPADMYRWARTISGLDYAAVTDHAMHNGRLTQQNMTEPEYLECRQAAKEQLDNGRYVTFTAVEQRCARGDTNCYFLTDAEPFYMKDGPITIQQMWQNLKGVPFISVPHLHPGVRKPERFDEIDPGKEKLVEIHSNHGRYEYQGNKPLFPGKGMIQGNSVQEILSRGHRLGFVAASDDHSGRAGSFDLTGIYAKELTRQALFEALQARHTFGTTGPRINLRFSLGEDLMGDEIRLAKDDPRYNSRRFHAEVVATQPITLLELVRGGKVIYSTAPGKLTASFDFADTEPLAQTWLGTEQNNPPTTYYYLRVTQQPAGAPGERNLAMAWSSPIFLSPQT